MTITVSIPQLALGLTAFLAVVYLALWQYHRQTEQEPSTDGTPETPPGYEGLPPSGDGGYFHPTLGRIGGTWGPNPPTDRAELRRWTSTARDLASTIIRLLDDQYAETAQLRRTMYDNATEAHETTPPEDREPTAPTSCADRIDAVLARPTRSCSYGGTMSNEPETASELERLRRWKAEAIPVLSAWDKVFDALGRPGGLGQSKAA